MSGHWRLIDSGLCGAAFNMALDEAIAAAVRSRSAPPTLRFYGWQSPAVTLGCFQRSSSVDLGYCRQQEIPVVRRLTGGRAILHGDELTYSFSARTDCAPFDQGLLVSYRSISAAFDRAFLRLGLRVEAKETRERGRVLTRSPLCFRSSSYGEILIERRKLVGSAQKRWKDGLLQQGSLPYAHDSALLQRIFGITGSAPDDGHMAALRTVLPGLDEGRLRQALIEAFEEVFGVSLAAARPDPEEVRHARDLEAGRYLQDAWNLRL